MDGEGDGEAGLKAFQPYVLRIGESVALYPLVHSCTLVYYFFISYYLSNHVQYRLSCICFSKISSYAIPV